MKNVQYLENELVTSNFMKSISVLINVFSFLCPNAFPYISQLGSMVNQLQVSPLVLNVCVCNSILVL